MLLKVRHDLPEVGFIEVPRDDTCSVRVFVDVTAELIVELGQSQASVCLRWNVNKSSHHYVYSAFNNTNCNKALHSIKIGKLCQ